MMTRREFGATLAAGTGCWVLQTRFGFDPLLSRLRDSLALITIGAFGSATQRTALSRSHAW